MQDIRKKSIEGNLERAFVRVDLDEGYMIEVVVTAKVL